MEARTLALPEVDLVHEDPWPGQATAFAARLEEVLDRPGGRA